MLLAAPAGTHLRPRSARSSSLIAHPTCLMYTASSRIYYSVLQRLVHSDSWRNTEDVFLSLAGLNIFLFPRVHCRPSDSCGQSLDNHIQAPKSSVCHVCEAMFTHKTLIGCKAGEQTCFFPQSYCALSPHHTVTIGKQSRGVTGCEYDC